MAQPTTDQRPSVKQTGRGLSRVDVPIWTGHKELLSLSVGDSGDGSTGDTSTKVNGTQSCLTEKLLLLLL